MLQSLHVKNIALIDDVEIEFTDGLNILTGETGAGKSIIIDAVNFALGSRMPKDVVRDDSEYALCELVFSVDDKETAQELEKLGVMSTDNQVILQRRIINGKTSCRANAETVPAGLIREIAALLIDIHGQHEHQSLFQKKNHRPILDSFCGEDFAEKLCKLTKAYDSYRQVEEEYVKASESRESAASELDYASFVVNEIETSRLSPGEDEILEKDFTRMNNSRRIAEILSGVRNALSSDGECASGMLGYALSSVREVVGLDDGARPLYDQLIAAEDLLGDCIRSLSAYEETLDFSPEDFARVSDRLDTINKLKMKYGQTIEAIKARLEEERSRIDRLSDYETYLEGLKQRKQQLYNEALDVCKDLSAIRHKEAGVLQKELADALKGLNFLDARFEISVSSNPDRISREGFDDVEFLISTNPGEDLKPLTDVASGGELSRIMLALKSVLAKRDGIRTLIFDEIDTGISGKTAQLVADRMTDISAHHQVIAVTHLPQIASHATTHFLIEKSAEGAHTSTKVHRLSYDESVEELARMLAGSSITDAVRENAKELKGKQKIS